MARCPKPRSAVKSERERLLTTPATKLLFEDLDQFDKEPSRELDLAENTLFVDRRDEIDIFNTLLARSLAHRLAPETPSTSTPESPLFRWILPNYVTRRGSKSPTRDASATDGSSD
jgi:hypothetical protein